MTLDVVTPEGAKIRSMAVEEVTLPGVLGEMGVLPGHEAMLAGLGVGPMVLRTAEGVHYYAISGGYIEILGDNVHVLSETCERHDEIDVDRAREKLASATEALTHRHPAEGETYQVALNSVKKAETRLAVAEIGRRK